MNSSLGSCWELWSWDWQLLSRRRVREPHSSRDLDAVRMVSGVGLALTRALRHESVPGQLTAFAPARGLMEATPESRFRRPAVPREALASTSTMHFMGDRTCSDRWQRRPGDVAHRWRSHFALIMVSVAACDVRRQSMSFCSDQRYTE